MVFARTGNKGRRSRARGMTKPWLAPAGGCMSPSHAERFSFSWLGSCPVGKRSRSQRAKSSQQRSNEGWPRYRSKTPKDQISPVMRRRQRTGDYPNKQYYSVSQPHLRISNCRAYEAPAEAEHSISRKRVSRGLDQVRSETILQVVEVAAQGIVRDR